MDEATFKRVAYALEETYGSEAEEEEAFQNLVSRLEVYPEIGSEFREALLKLIGEGATEECRDIVERYANRYVRDKEEAYAFLCGIKERLVTLWGKEK